ncbi:hypothetical protein HT031_001511 [Scenedesmus sp. PABB004]|nr:hypothetical protein HT031_001511 [Scenedesmus sp. PABB004]
MQLQRCLAARLPRLARAALAGAPGAPGGAAAAAAAHARAGGGGGGGGGAGGGAQAAGRWWTAAAGAAGLAAAAAWAPPAAAADAGAPAAGAAADAPAGAAPPPDGKLLPLSTRRRIFFKYEKRIRDRSSLEKIYEYFATHERHGVKVMSAADVVRALVHTYPPAGSSVERAGFLDGERSQQVDAPGRRDAHRARSQLLHFFDHNQDGTIDFNEFVLIVICLAVPERDVGAVFDFIDLDNNGVLDEAEFAQERQRRGAAAAGSGGRGSGRREGGAAPRCAGARADAAVPAARRGAAQVLQQLERRAGIQGTFHARAGKRAIVDEDSTCGPRAAPRAAAPRAAAAAGRATPPPRPAPALVRARAREPAVHRLFLDEGARGVKLSRFRDFLGRLQDGMVRLEFDHYDTDGAARGARALGARRAARGARRGPAAAHGRRSPPTRGAPGARGGRAGSGSVCGTDFAHSLVTAADVRVVDAYLDKARAAAALGLPATPGLACQPQPAPWDPPRTAAAAARAPRRAAQVEALPPALARARVSLKDFQAVAHLRRHVRDISFALDFCSQARRAAGSARGPLAPPRRRAARLRRRAAARPRRARAEAEPFLPAAAAQIERPLPRAEFAKLLSKALGGLRLAPSVVEIIYALFGDEAGSLDGPALVSALKRRNYVPGYKKGQGVSVEEDSEHTPVLNWMRCVRSCTFGGETASR